MDLDINRNKKLNRNRIKKQNQDVIYLHFLNIIYYCYKTVSTLNIDKKISKKNKKFKEQNGKIIRVLYKLKIKKIKNYKK